MKLDPYLFFQYQLLNAYISNMGVLYMLELVQ